ncbi:nucleotidyl transferase AbiEii/AbiGii toxin family protein [Candidatus Nomurabacteria bacterium]|nr:nucleotidyl transferase AbiEii/AbiGii toxin family protein [Candidatus Nomurabacteria bacterium]
MLDIKDIAKYYDNSQYVSPRHILREYLQYKILDLFVDSKIGNKISFLGGTCIRIVHNSFRFSEDLDFDNFNLSYDEFIEASETIKRGLSLEGFDVEIRNVKKGAYHCYIRFPELLYKNKLTPLLSEKILIQIDTLSHGFEYRPETFLLNKFGVLRNILVTPPDILLSQKIYALFNRKRPKGRDFFDVVFLLGFTKPNYEYLDYRLKIKKAQDLKEYILGNIQYIDLKTLAKDVAPFLLKSGDVRKVEMFREVIEKSL